MKLKSILAVLSAFVGFAASSAVTPGEWNTNFTDSLAYAEKNNTPIVVVWGNTGCSHCKELHNVLESDTIMNWAEEHPIMMVSKYEKSSSKNADYLAAREWILSINPKLRNYPFVGVYWKKSDGTVVCKTAFTGRDGTMPCTTPAGDLAGQLVGSLDQLVGEYPPAPVGGTTFMTADTVYDRLEAIESTRTVLVPVVRKSGDAADTNVLKAKYPFGGEETIRFSWQVGETEKKLSVPTPAAAFSSGNKVKLSLLDANGTLLDSSFIAMVGEADNSLTNPAWIGEEFTFSEWTMDLDAAKTKTAKTSGDAYTFVYFTGALWCPWCQGLEADVLATDAFDRFARKNKINLVELDNPRRPTDPSGPSGAPPTLLRYPAGMNNVIAKMVSGASYLSRKSIAPADAEAILERNHRLGYDGPSQGGYCAPEAARSGYPTIVLLRKDGTVAGRFNYYAPTTTDFDTDENMQRLKDFLYLAEEGDYLASWRTTTTRVLDLDEVQSAPFQINDTTEWFKLEGPFENYITVNCVADEDVTLTITDAEGNTIGQPAKRRVTVERPSKGALYLKATCYENASKTMYAEKSTRFTALFALTTSNEKPENTVPFTSLAKDELMALNNALFTKRSTTVPIYESVNLGGKRLVGALDVSVTSANKISAKFAGEKKIAFSGTWSEINVGSGEVSAVLKKKASNVTYALRLTMNAQGGFGAGLLVGDETIGSGEAASGDISSYEGNYTVTLVDRAAKAGGTGYLTLKVTNKGKATVKGIMPDGTSISVSAQISPDLDGTATLPVYKSTSKYTVSMALAIEPDAYVTWEDTEADKYTVRATTGCFALYETNWTTEFAIYGGYWKSTSPLDICKLYKLSDELLVVAGGATNDTVEATSRGFQVTKDFLSSLAFTKTTGAFSGKARFLDESGKKITATVKGVLMPGWIDCGCTGEPVVERPFGSGTIYYKVNGNTISYPFDLVAQPEAEE